MASRTMIPKTTSASTPPQAGAPLHGDGRSASRQPGVRCRAGHRQRVARHPGRQPYRSEATEAKLKDLRYSSRIHKKGKRNKALTKREQTTNETASKVRSRVEHMFGHTVSSMGGKLVRTIGIVRAKATIRLRKLASNMSRFTFLEWAKALVA